MDEPLNATDELQKQRALALLIRYEAARMDYEQEEVRNQIAFQVRRSDAKDRHWVMEVTLSSGSLFPLFSQIAAKCRAAEDWNDVPHTPMALRDGPPVFAFAGPTSRCGSYVTGGLVICYPKAACR